MATFGRLTETIGVASECRWGIQEGKNGSFEGATRLWGMRAKVKDAEVSEGSDMIEACFDDRMLD